MRISVSVGGTLTVSKIQKQVSDKMRKGSSCCWN